MTANNGGKVKTWICETTCIATKTLIVEAENRKAALELLRNPKYDNSDPEGIDVSYGPTRMRRVVCKEKESQ